MNSISSKKPLRQLNLVRYFVNANFYDTLLPLFPFRAPGLNSHSISRLSGLELPCTSVIVLGLLLYAAIKLGMGHVLI